MLKLTPLEYLPMDRAEALEIIHTVRSKVPEAELSALDADYASRYIEAAPTTGYIALEGANAETPAPAVEVPTPEATPKPETELETRLPGFLNPNIKLGASDQLSTMREFWNTLGREVPELSAEQQGDLEVKLATHPDRRVVPTPLLSLMERKQTVETAKVFRKNQFSPTSSAIWTPDESWLYGKLLVNPEATVQDGKKSYGMLYKTDANGTLVKREAYIAGLVASGKAVTSPDGTVWVFPVMDVQTNAPRTREYASKLHAKVSPTMTPEALITMQLLQQANGTPNSRWEPDFANEAVYELDKHDAPKALVRAAGVLWNPDGRRVRLDDWYGGRRYGDGGVRAEESGL